MRRVLLGLVAALLVGGFAYHWVAGREGYLVLVLGRWVVELNLWGALLLLAAALLVAWMGLRLLLWLARPAAWWRARGERREVRRRHRLLRGLTAYLEGDWPRALEQLSSALGEGEEGGCARLGAAAAAFNLGDLARCRALLAEAEREGAVDPLGLALLRGRLAAEEEDWARALGEAQRAVRLRPDHPAALRLEAEARRGLEDWEGLERLLPDLRRHRALAEGELAALERQVYAALLRRRCREARALPAAERAEAVRALDRFWARLPARLRREPELVLAWLDALAALGRPERAARRMARFLARRWDGRLAARYAALPGGDSLKRVKQLEGWLAEHPDDPDLLEALAALCARCELWGKARDYYERALALRPAPATWLALGRLLEARGEAQAACERYREGLRAAVES